MLQKGSLQCTVLGQTCATLCLVFPHWVLDISPLILSVNPVLLSKLFHGCLYPNNITGLCKIQTLHYSKHLQPLFSISASKFFSGKVWGYPEFTPLRLTCFLSEFSEKSLSWKYRYSARPSFDHQLFPRDAGPLLFLGSSRVLYFHTHRDLTIVYDLADAWWENLEALVQGDKPILPSNYALRSKNCLKYCSP